MKSAQAISLILIPIVAIFIIKVILVHPSFSDENLYYAMGKIVGQGQRPYDDFNFVHPPLQLYFLAGIFTFLGASLTAAKLLPLFASSASVLLIFLISKRLFDQKTALASALLFLITPAFLAFSDQGYGMWEAIFFILLSVYICLRGKYAAGSFLFSIAVFTRYLSLLFLPLIILIFINRKIKWKPFVMWTAVFICGFFLLFYLAYGYNFVDQTVLFQIFAKRNLNILLKLPFQYLGFGFFSIFLAAVSLTVGVMRKDKLVMLLSLYPIAIDAVIFFGFTTIIYHYFLISLAFLFIGLGKSFIASKDKFIQAGIILIILFSIYSNYLTIDYYQNPAYAKHFYDVADFVASRTSPGDKIFGESSITSYIMFTKNISVSSSYLDSFLSYLIYKDEKTVIANLEREKPKIIIDMSNYYETNPVFSQYLSEEYQKVMEFPGIPTYIIYQRS